MKLRQETALRQQVSQKLGQNLRRVVSFLELSNLDLAEALREAAADNPWLRLGPPRAAAEATPDAEAQGPSLIAHVLDRLPALVPDPADRAIALALAEALDPDGLLAEPVEEIARRLGRPRRRVEAVLLLLQRIEPRGLFARSLSECLALQLAESDPVPPEMRRVLDALPCLAQGGPDRLARETGLSAETVAAALAALRGLNPRPAAQFAPHPTRTRIADLVFVRGDAGWQAQLNPETLPRLSLAPLACDVPRGSALSKDRTRARGLIGALDRRNAALMALGRLIAQEQAGFLEHGPAALRVLTMREAAQRIGWHESSVGRLVRSSSARTPAGTVPLRRFFARAATRQGAPARAGAPAIQARIEALIAAEPAANPLSDSQITQALNAAGLDISRRVIARLRDRAGIPNRAERRRR